MLKEFLEYFSRIGRGAGSYHDYDDEIKIYVDKLKKHGFIILDHLVGSTKFQNVKNKIDKNIEKYLNIQFPCLAQSKIDEIKHKDLIKSNFLASTDDLEKRNLTFSRGDFKNYSDMLKKYSPSTLTLKMIDDEAFLDIWLDKKLIDIIQLYMGFVPEMIEAYTRRNFPCKHRVMNHYWHRDKNHPKYLLKAFIFFTDCNLNTGAHHFISGSVNSKEFSEDRYFEDSEIHSKWPIGSKNHIISNVKAGTIILEDTRGLHKAGTPDEKYRDLGYAVFLPPNIFRNKNSLYKISKKNYYNLSKKQKLFIPSQNIE